MIQLATFYVRKHKQTAFFYTNQMYGPDLDKECPDFRKSQHFKVNSVVKTEEKKKKINRLLRPLYFTVEHSDKCNYLMSKNCLHELLCFKESPKPLD